MKKKIIRLLIIGMLAVPASAQQQSFHSFAEYGASVHGGDNVPLWQVSNQHGLSSLKNNTYLRAGTFYRREYRDWTFDGGLDMAVAAGFTSTFVLQQAFVNVSYKWLGLTVGSKEIDSPLLNQQLSSGGLTWSGNARPIPQVGIGIYDYVHLTKSIQFKAEMSYGWFTDNKYQKGRVGEGYWYTKDIKYHHKSFFFRFGKPRSKWMFDLGMSLDTQFGGNKSAGADAGDLGNSLKDYFQVFIPRGGDAYFQGNYMGSEHLRVTYKNKDLSLALYLENYYDDFSGMGKRNGMDGLWGIEYKSPTPQAISGIVLEYYQTTNQSGPLHGLDDSVAGKTGGADDYYNNDWYPGWVHWGMTMANPLIASPIYNRDGDMSFKYNRIKAIHLGWEGYINPQLSYRAKLSYNQTWGTPFKPTIEILENYSTFVECKYIPAKRPEWCFTASLAFDTGEIYGDNAGFQLKIKRKL